MASNINRVTLGGRLTRDPELRATASGRSVLSFCLAVGEDYKDQASGEWKELAHFVDCTIFGQRADSLNRIMVKGMKVTVEGRLRYSSWEKDGQKRSKLDVVVDNIEIPDRPKDAAQTPYQAQPAQQVPQQAYAGPYGQQDGGYDVFGDEIPF